MTGRGKPLVVNAFWDDEANVWVASSTDVPGLATEAESMNALVAKLKVMIPELLEANGYADEDDVPFELLSKLYSVAHRHPA
jgi:predicted RNase H-like HicB family nuclease